MEGIDMKMMLRSCLFTSLVIARIYGASDEICFSFDRAPQLYAHLESVEKFVTGLDSIYILYRSSDEHNERAYRDVMQRFPQVVWVHQGAEPKKDFKPLLMKTLNASKAPYIVFAVDDIIVQDVIDLNVCTQALEKTGAYAFYLRLGKNINHCYARNNQITPVPLLKQVDKDIFMWKFDDGLGDWRYPNSVDLTVFRKSTVMRDISRLNFVAPNSFECSWGSLANHKLNGLCFGESKMVNIPLNLVQNEVRSNRSMRLMSPGYLLEKYFDGYKIDIQKIAEVKHNTVHFEIVPTFIKR